MKISIKYGLFIGLLILLGGVANAQNPISLETAIDIALKNNLSIKNEKLKAEYQKSLINTSKMIPTSTIAAEVGQINSVYLDSRLSIGQTISFPKVYESQKILYNELWKSSTLNVAITEHELKKQVTQTFYYWIYLQQKRQLLQFADSLYATFLNRAELRLAKGESNILEKVTAENQLGQINVQLRQLQDDIELTKLRFRYLLNSSDNYLPTFNNYKLTFNTKTDLETLKEHPNLKFLNQQQQVADAIIEVEKKKLLPTLSFVYNNGSIRGTGADNVVYNGWHRFQSVQVGVGIPIFTTALKAKINSEKVNKLVVENNYSVGLQQLNNAYLVALGEYNKFNKTVEYYEKTALSNAILINTTAQQQLINGSINYLEWVTLTNQATNIRNDYIEAVKNLNESIIQINSLVNK